MGHTVGELKVKILDKLFELVDKADLADIPALASIYENLHVETPIIEEPATEDVGEPETEPETVEE